MEFGKAMTLAELEKLIESIDSKNAKYILNDPDVMDKFHSLNRWLTKDVSSMSVLNEEKDPEARRRSIAEMVRRHLEEAIREFDGRHLTPANAKVGDGATVNYYSDRHAGTIVRVTKATITIRRDKAILSPDFKPEWIPGGFAAHCTNQDEQTYTYEPNENGELTTLQWSTKYNQYGQPGNLTASKGRHEFYDYNF